MIDSQFYLNIGGNFKQIEDIIDSRKLLGQYNVHRPNGVNYKCVYSSSTSAPDNRCLRFEENMISNEGDSLNSSHIKQTDSEITVVRVRCSDLALKNCRTKWDMHDIAIPGDGSHLGESPSMVNLATLVGTNRPFEGEEYLVPLSSWDPYYKLEENRPEKKCYSDSVLNVSEVRDNKSKKIGNDLKMDSSDLICVRPNWAGRISKFIRKHCTKTKTPPDTFINKN